MCFPPRPPKGGRGEGGQHDQELWGMTAEKKWDVPESERLKFTSQTVLNHVGYDLLLLEEGHHGLHGEAD